MTDLRMKDVEILGAETKSLLSVEEQGVMLTEAIEQYQSLHKIPVHTPIGLVFTQERSADGPVRHEIYIGMVESTPV